MQSTLSNKSKYIAEAKLSIRTLEVHFYNPPSLKLGKDAKRDINNLGDIESDQASYLAFIHQYGTHYFDDAKFGGLVRALYKMDQSFYSSSESQRIQGNALASLLNFFDGLRVGDYKTRDIEERFEQNTKGSIMFYPEKLFNTFADWSTRVARNPWLFSGNLKPISDLISNPTKRSNMETAIKQYRFGAFLDELLREINSLKILHSGSGWLKRLEEKRDKLHKKLNKFKIKEDQIEELAKDIKDFRKENTKPSQIHSGAKRNNFNWTLIVFSIIIIIIIIIIMLYCHFCKKLFTNRNFGQWSCFQSLTHS